MKNCVVTNMQSDVSGFHLWLWISGFLMNYLDASELTNVLETLLLTNLGMEYNHIPTRNKTLLIKTQLYVEDVNSINALDMDFRLDFFLWHQWNVTGNFCLTYETNVKKLGLRESWKEISEKVTVSKNHFTFFWIPDTYIVNAKSVETPSKVTSTQVLTISKVDDTCIMEYTARFAAVVGCQMEFKHYPVDIQQCPVTFRSYSYPMDTVHYEWVDKDSSPLKNPHLKLLQHNLELKKLQFTVETLNVKYSCIAVMFILERQISYHLMQVFAPSAMIVMLSWFSFWIGIDAIPGRVTLVVTSLLSLFTQFSGIRGGLPPASYINGIDIWMATCMLFVFCSFAEFVLVKYFDKQRQVFFQQQRKQTLVRTLCRHNSPAGLGYGKRSGSRESEETAFSLDHSGHRAGQFSP
ncbi:glycine receptor subunit alpha-4-like isoform X2 [Tachypleus tridentatus]|uniref:glycine receptor subunit alpha-4-like isoform X2 n=1 Tax=Tachypleus tridentatus TaxID=6853 RepID=UPI003FCFFCE6